MPNPRSGKRGPVVTGDDFDSASDSTAPPIESTAARSRAADVLVEPIKVAEFWKNRRGETVRAMLVSYEGRACFDLRQHFTSHDGGLQPTKKGINIVVARLPELARAVDKSLRKAIELGLLPAEGGDA